MKFPLWATPERRNRLVELFLNSHGGYCVLGHGPSCPQLLGHYYEVASEELIADWKREDSQIRSIEWKREKRRLHAAPHRHLPKVRTRAWDSIVQENYLAQRPVFGLVGIGVNPFTFQRMALVEIPGLRLSIFVDLSGIPIPRRKLRKLFRHPKGAMPQEFYNRIEQQVRGYFG